MRELFLYEYHIADFSWQLQMPMPLSIKDENKNFISFISSQTCSKPGKNTKVVLFEKAEQLSNVPQNAFYINNAFFVKEETGSVIYRCPIMNRIPVAEVHFHSDGNIYYRFLEMNGYAIRNSCGLITALNLETILLSRSAVMLHACLVRYKGKAILFSAPSGTGKSTQGDLWVKFRDAEVLNGDRAGIYQKNRVWRASGLPYAGSSGIYRNENAPIQAIVYLAQGKENKITRLNAGQAFRLLYPQIMVHYWEPDFVSKSSDILISLLNDIPVYYFSCTPDVSAVETLEKQLITLYN